MNEKHRKAAELVAAWATMRRDVRAAKSGRSSTKCSKFDAMKDGYGPVCAFDRGPSGPNGEFFHRIPFDQWCQGCKDGAESNRRYHELAPKLAALTRQLVVLGLELAMGCGAAHDFNAAAICRDCGARNRGSYVEHPPRRKVGRR